MKLTPHQVEKPWGRTSLPHTFGGTGGKRIGEIWFEAPQGGKPPPLLVKYIFTSEKLSIQVHPNDDQANRRGLAKGKSECWYILDAEPAAALGLGAKQPVDPADLREAALDGSIEELIDWRPVKAGEFYYIPAGTVHAIGAGISLLEFQQNADVTYRLYDYGRPRELHLDDGIAVSRTEAPYPADCWRPAGGEMDAVLLNGPHFSLLRASSPQAVPASAHDRPRWIMPIEGVISSCGVSASVGECLLANPGDALEFGSGAIALIGFEGTV